VDQDMIPHTAGKVTNWVENVPRGAGDLFNLWRSDTPWLASVAAFGGRAG